MIILGTNSIKDTGYDVDNSCRFDDGSSDYLNRTPGSSGNRKTWTWSSWVKKSTIGAGYQFLFSCTDASTSTGSIGTNYNGDNKIYFRDDLISLNLTPNAVHRDTSAWYHIVVALDTTQATASNRAKMWINGTQVTSFSTETYPSQDTDGSINLVSGSYQHRIATYSGSSNFFDGYLAETVFIDGTALDPTSFGEFDEDSGIWKPIDVSGLTFGTNGFYLDFENSGALGADVSGNTNNFTVNNLTAIDQSTDTCTNNFCTWNSIADNLDVTLSEGNLKVVHGTQLVRRPVISTFGVSKGKWFWEWKNTTSSTPANIEVGIVNYASPSSQGRYLGQSLQGDADYTTYVGDGYIDMSGTQTNTGTTYTTETISIAVDMDNTLIYFYKNGSLVNSGGTNFSGMENGSGFIFMANGDRSGGSSYTASVNFGNPPYSESGGNSDGNGYGNFSMAVPSGYYALCTKNLGAYGG